ncbi:MAG: hypothetical protein JXA21_26055 [Anaerolineae bacterium]|nr:hypothetical protein [Anaerolineae bacterium]
MWNYIIRFAPPLVIRQDDIDWALERIIPTLTEHTWYRAAQIAPQFMLARDCQILA